MELNVVQRSVEQRQTAQYGFCWSSNKQHTRQHFLCFQLLQWQNKLFYHREIQNFTMYSTYLYTYFFLFLFLFFESESSAAKKRNSFGIKASGSKATG